MSHKFDEFCQRVAANVSGLSVQDVATMTNATTGDDPVRNWAAIDIGKLLDLIVQIIEAIKPLLENCPLSTSARQLAKANRRVRNRLEREARQYCEGCQKDRFGIWATKGESIGSAITAVAAEMGEADTLHAIEDLTSPDYLLV